MGYTNARIMEDVSDNIYDCGLDRTFAGILREFDPNFIFVFFHKGEKMDAVVFELGYICCLYQDIIRDKLKFLYYEMEYDFAKETTAYIDSLLPDVNYSYCNDLQPYKRSVLIMHRMMANR